MAKIANVLLIAELAADNSLHTSTLATLTAAKQLGESTVLIISDNCKGAIAELQQYPQVSSIKFVESTALANPTAEQISAIVLQNCNDYSYIITPATTFGKNFLPRVAAKLNCAQISDIIKIESADTFVRPIYAGNAFETVQSLEEIKVISVRPTSFAPAESAEEANENTKQLHIQQLSEIPKITSSKFVTHHQVVSKRPDLSRASTVVSGGRGLQSAEKFSILEKLADKLNAAIGATRAAVDAEFITNEHQVGQTGKVVAPQLYFAIGISGAVQHLAGIKDSKIIVAINNDPDAAIFQVADYGIVGDLFEIIPELIEKL